MSGSWAVPGWLSTTRRAVCAGRPHGKGATIGSVIAMRQAVAPAAVGVDIGCGMTAVRTNLRPDHLPDDLRGPVNLGTRTGVFCL